MAANEIHVGDIGTAFDVTLYDGDDVVDLTGYTSLIFNFIKPDGTCMPKTAVPKTDGTDGILRYITIIGDLDQAGTWILQAVVELPTGKWSSDTTKFKVHGNVACP